MNRSKKSANPFYALLLIAGIAFVLTATTYGVMAFRERDLTPLPTLSASVTAAPHPLMAWMSEHGETALLTELAILGVCTFAAIATDDYWQRRNKNRT